MTYQSTKRYKPRFCPESGVSVFLRKAGNNPSDHMAKYPTPFLFGYLMKLFISRLYIAGDRMIK
jgi:hypothetical protein